MKIGERCRIGPNVVIGPRVIIQDGVCLKNCTILADSLVKSHSWVANSIIGWRCNIGQWVNWKKIEARIKIIKIGRFPFRYEWRTLAF